MDLRFRLLGPMEILVEGRPVGMPGAAECALLVQLLLSPGRTIPATMLVDRLWSESGSGSRPPTRGSGRLSEATAVRQRSSRPASPHELRDLHALTSVPGAR